MKINGHTSCFIIERRTLKHDLDYFGGFYNETDQAGSDMESQSWELEDWFGSPDEALQFKSFGEAKAYFDAIEKKYNMLYNITLYGWSDVKDVSGTNWYPLKTFAYS